jgi:hypothetical protein
MEAFFLSIPKRLFQTLFLFLSFILLANYNQKSQREVYPSFYYWKTNFGLTEKEKGLLYRLSVKNLYVKFFDVEWNYLAKAPKPIAGKFRNNPMFPGFVKGYGNTKFYNYTFTRCSYLRDFVKKSPSRLK